MRRRIVLLAFGLLFTSVGCGEEETSRPDSPVEPRIENLQWLAGSWRGPGFEGIVEEQWLPYRGGSLVGTFRLVVSGRTRVVELLTIVAEGDGVVYRFNHFTPQLKRWEREKEPLLYHLADLTSSTATFRNPHPGEHEPETIVYHLQDWDTLVVTLTFARDESLEAEAPIRLVLLRQAG